MEIYHFDEKTGAYLGAGVADPDPLTPGAWLLPAYSTAVKPDAVPAKWNGQRWTQESQQFTSPIVTTEEPDALPTQRKPTKARKKKE